MEPVFVLIVIFSSALLALKLSLDHKRQKMISGSSTEGNSLGTGELKRLIREAVDESVFPLLERVEKAETRLDESEQLRLGAGSDVEASEAD
jgi:hypothetical protein